MYWYLWSCAAFLAASNCLELGWFGTGGEGFAGWNVCERDRQRHPSLEHNAVQSGVLTRSLHRSTYSRTDLSVLKATKDFWSLRDLRSHYSFTPDSFFHFYSWLHMTHLVFWFVVISSRPYSTFMLCPLTWTFISALVSVIIVCHVTSPPAALFPLVIMISLTVVKLELPVNLPVAIFKRLHYNTHNAIHSTSVIPVLGANCNSSLFLLPGPQCWLNPGCDALKALMQSTEQFL